MLRANYPNVIYEPKKRGEMSRENGIEHHLVTHPNTGHAYRGDVSELIAATFTIQEPP